MTNQYKVSSGYRFLIEEDTVVKVYFLEGLPFTWDPIEDKPTPSMIHESIAPTIIPRNYTKLYRVHACRRDASTTQ